MTASTNSVYVTFNLEITSALENAKIKIQVTVTVGTDKFVYDTDDIPVGTMRKLGYREFCTFHSRPRFKPLDDTVCIIFACVQRTKVWLLNIIVLLVTAI